jgi:amino acid transporter
MNNKSIWAIAVAVLIGYLCFWHSFVKPFDFSDLIESIGFISTLLTVLIVSSVIAFLFALIPLKNRNYKERLAVCYPLSLILVCIIVAWSFYSTGPNYNTIKTEPNCNCLSVHDGVFQSGDLLIERKGNLQIQTNTKTKDQEHFGVTWLTDCEYQLNSMDDIIKVKIVSVDQTSYDCYLWSKGRTSKRKKVQVSADPS